MSVKYEVLKRLVRVAGLKKRWLSATTEGLGSDGAADEGGDTE